MASALNTPKKDKASPIWNYFDLIPDLPSKATCKICSQVMSLVSTEGEPLKITLGCLKFHIESNHSVEWLKISGELSSRSPASGKKRPRDAENESESLNTPKKDKAAPIWNYIELIPDLPGKVKCKICSQVMSLSSTHIESHLESILNHIESNHSVEWLKLEGELISRYPVSGEKRPRDAENESDAVEFYNFDFYKCPLSRKCRQF